MISLKQSIKSSPVLARLAWPIYRELLIQRSRYPSKGPVPVFSEETHLRFKSLRTFDEFQKWSQNNALEVGNQREMETSLSPLQARPFSIPGTCALCGLETYFKSNFDYANPSADGRLVPNFRENLACAHCGMKNRLRAALHLFVQEFHPLKSQRIYITEQLGAAYRWLKGRGYAMSGSEYVPGSGPFGSSRRGIRNEDLGALTWENGTFDFILSFDVLEHVPDVTKCFSEIHRSLRPEGKLLFTAPFSTDLPEMQTRAVLRPDGTVLHLMDPEYHGGNVTDATKGTLCFRHFAWDTVPMLKAAGFSEAEVWLFWSRKLGYIGGSQIVIVAHKGG